MDMKTSTMMLHCGANAATIDEVANVYTPAGTETHVPVPHIEIYEQLMRRMGETGLRLVSEQHALHTKKEIPGCNWFALLEFESERLDYNLVVGPRNSHGMFYAADLAMGDRVFICDNLALSGQFKLSRKHTKNIRRDLPEVMARAVGSLMNSRVLQDKRIEAYRSTPLDMVDADHLIMELARTRVIAANKVLPVWQEFDTPTFDEHLDDDGKRTVWTLRNAVTECYKDTSVFTLPKRGQAMHGVFDSIVGLDKIDDIVDADFEVLEAA